MQKLMPGLSLVAINISPFSAHHSDIWYRLLRFTTDLIPTGYYMNLQQNPRTLLPKFFGMFTYQVENALGSYTCNFQDDAVEHMVLDFLTFWISANLLCPCVHQSHSICLWLKFKICNVCPGCQNFVTNTSCRRSDDVLNQQQSL